MVMRSGLDEHRQKEPESQAREGLSRERNCLDDEEIYVNRK